MSFNRGKGNTEFGEAESEDMLQLQDFITRVLTNLFHASFVDYKVVSIEFEDRLAD
jgi:hypothetical protein